MAAKGLVLVPIRCFTCGNLVADKFEKYQEMTGQEDVDPGNVLDTLGVERYCCRRMLLTTVETIQQVIPFYEAMQKRKLEIQSEME